MKQERKLEQYVPTFILTANKLHPDCEVDPTLDRYIAK